MAIKDNYIEPFKFVPLVCIISNFIIVDIIYLSIFGLNSTCSKPINLWLLGSLFFDIINVNNLVRAIINDVVNNYIKSNFLTILLTMIWFIVGNVFLFDSNCNNLNPYIYNYMLGMFIINYLSLTFILIIILSTYYKHNNYDE